MRRANRRVIRCAEAMLLAAKNRSDEAAIELVEPLCNAVEEMLEKRRLRRMRRHEEAKALALYGAKPTEPEAGE